MYLSRVEIDTDNRQKIKDLSHLGAYHNWVERSFPAEMPKVNGSGTCGGLIR
jgi:CRISPR system Cascade subunit CasE